MITQQKRLVPTGLQLKLHYLLMSLIESVCILRKEGLRTIFTHRSFQEYFAAYCISKFIDEHCSEILLRICSRWSDNVIAMIFEMNREKLERLFIVPTLTNILSDLKGSGCGGDIGAYCKYFGLQIICEPINENYVLMPIMSNNKWAFVSSLHRLYGNIYRQLLDTSGDGRILQEYISSDKKKMRVSKSTEPMQRFMFGENDAGYAQNC